MRKSRSQANRMIMWKKPQRYILIWAGILTSLYFLSHPAKADYPDRAITAVVPFAPGSAVDIVARVIAGHLNEALKQPVIIQNKPGADGIIGLTIVAGARPDGYTILISGGAETKSPALHRNLPFDPIRQIAPIASLGSSVYVIAVNTKLGAKTLGDLLTSLRASPDKYNAAVSGNSTLLALDLFNLRAGVRVQAISFGGTAQVATSLLSGESDLAIMDELGFASIVKSPTIKFLAVADTTRLSNLPDLPTSAEAGLPSYKAGTTFGVYGTGGTPDAIIQRLNAEINRILALPEVENSLAPLGLNIDRANNSVGVFRARYLADLALWKDVVQQAGIKPAD